VPSRSKIRAGALISATAPPNPEADRGEDRRREPDQQQLAFEDRHSALREEAAADRRHGDRPPWQEVALVVERCPERHPEPPSVIASSTPWDAVARNRKSQTDERRPFQSRPRKATAVTISARTAANTTE
jgi:hypothetical protein